MNREKKIFKNEHGLSQIISNDSTYRQFQRKKRERIGQKKIFE